MVPHPSRFLACLAPLVLLGCSETGLRLAPPASDDDSASSAPGGGPSAWDDLDDPELPDEHFVVAWSTPDEGRWTPSRIDLVDVLGSVVDSYVQPGWVGEHATYFLDDFDWTELHPAAPATALVNQYRTFSAGDTGGVEEYDRVVWNLDLVSGDWRMDLLVTSDDVVFLPGAQQTLQPPLPVLQLHVVADPTDRDFVWLLWEGAVGGDTWVLTRVDVTGASQPISRTAEELYGASTSDRFRNIVTTAGASLDGDPILTVAGYTSPLSLPEGEPHIWQAQAFGMQGQVDWNITIPVASGGLTPRALESTTGSLTEVTSTLQEQSGDYGCWSRSFTLVDAEAWWDIEVGDASACPRPGPLLDASNHTFLWVGATPGAESMPGGPEEIVVSHRGADVWSIDRFRLGLSETEFRIHGLLRAN